MKAPVGYLLLTTFLLIAAVSANAASNPHPRLLLSPEDVELIARTSSLPAGFDTALQAAKTDADRYLQAIPDVPVPKDAGGGYTHEQHKRNSVTIQNAGFLYQVTANEAYVQSYVLNFRDLQLSEQCRLLPILIEQPVVRICPRFHML